MFHAWRPTKALFVSAGIGLSLRGFGVLPGPLYYGLFFVLLESLNDLIVSIWEGIHTFPRSLKLLCVSFGIGL
jgi:hypothetical protein